MKCVLLALALVCGIQAIDIPQAMKNLDIQKMAGTWHTVAMAARDAALLANPCSPLRVFVKDLRVTPEDNLEITVNLRDKNQCVEKTIIAKKTDVEAKFQIDFLQEDQMFVVDADSQDHLIFCVENSTVPQSLVCQYLARTATPNQDKVMEKFNSVLKAEFVHPKVVLDFTQAQTKEPCRV